MNCSKNKLAFIGEYIPESLNGYYKECGKNNFSGAIFNSSLIKGLKTQYSDINIFSCPSVGHYPVFSKCKKTKTFLMEDNVLCIGYNNLIVYNNYSKKRNILKYFRKKYHPNDFVDVLVSEVSYFSLITFKHIKKRYKHIKGILLVFDLPEDIVGDKKSKLYRFFKKLSFKKIKRLYRLFDGFVYLAQSMNKEVNYLGKPYRVFPCFADLEMYKNIVRKENNNFVITYSGMVTKQYNIDLLLEAFSLISRNDFVLQIIGDGDGVQLVKHASESDKRIRYLGVVTPDKALEYQLNSNCLVNPRLPNNRYASESFPSKTISYLLTLNPVVSYKFCTMPKEIQELLQTPNDYTPQSLADAILKCRNVKKNKDIYSVLGMYSCESAGKIFKELFEYVKN